MLSRELRDDIGYKAATDAFPMLTIAIVLDSVWGSTAWGRYWGWDPKETAALVTWLIHGTYPMHESPADGMGPVSPGCSS